MSWARAPPWCPASAAGAPSREAAARERAELGVALDFSSRYFPSWPSSFRVGGVLSVLAGVLGRGLWAVPVPGAGPGRVLGPGGGRRGVTQAVAR